MSSKTENKTSLYLATWPFSKMADVEENTVNDRDDQFLSFLKKTSLENFKDAFIKQGVEKIEHLQDIDEEDAKEFGLSKIQLKRLKREYALWNAEKTKSAPPSSNATCSTGTTSYKTSSSSVVLSLRPGFKDFFHTRDGQGNIVVSSKALKVKYQNLWYDNPLNPFQTFSNRFILQMAEYRMQFSKSLRECELWCRRMRQQRISLMIASVQKCALSKWTPYYRGRSVWGLHQQMCERYPQVQSCLEAEDGQEVPRNMYDSLCKFTEGIEKAHNLAKEARQQCDEQIALCGTPVKEGEHEYTCYIKYQFLCIHAFTGITLTIISSTPIVHVLRCIYEII